MKKTKLLTPLISLLTVVLCVCISFYSFVSKSAEAADYKLSPIESLSEFRDIEYTPWDVQSASQYVGMRDLKPYTIMIYMNGSDLETENGAATNDLIEMLDSGLSSENANIVILTGGTYRWQNDVIPSNECVLWEIADGEIYEICGIGLKNMGDPGTLASFIDFSTSNFPAEKFGLIMWDHGGGSIAGYGHDEKFNSSNLTLLDMKYAFSRAVPSDSKLEFLGFDSCLMATVEMAIVASDFAHYLIASEDLEPGDGWDYSFLSVLNDNPNLNGADLGIAITDYFMQYYESATDEILTMSVTDLSKAEYVMDTMGELMNLCSDVLINQRPVTFTTLAGKRSRTKTFGMGSPSDSECDMVDIGDMAAKLSDLYPYETDKIFAALDNSVVYNRHNSDIDLYGLSTFYIYGAKESGNMSLNTYASLNINDDYTRYLYNFYNMLRMGNTAGKAARSRSTGNAGYSLEYADEIISAELTVWQPVAGKRYRMVGIQSDPERESYDMPDEAIAEGVNAFWPKIKDKNVCMYRINNSENLSLFAIPAELNNRECDLIVAVSEEHPDGKILGVRYEDGFIIQKGYDKLKNGDKLAFRYLEKNFEDDTNGVSWKAGEEIPVSGELVLEWAELDKNEYYYSLLLTDIRHNEDFTDLRPVVQE